MRENKLKKIIAEIFVDDKSEILKSLIDLGIDKYIIKVFDMIDKTENITELKKQAFIATIATSFITQINDKLSTIENSTIKVDLEYTIGEIAKLLLTKIVSKTKININELIEYISSPLKVTYELNNWDYDALVRIMNFDLKHSLNSSNQTTMLEHEDYYYDWCCASESLNELAYCLKDKKIIKSINEFKALFSAGKKEKKIRFQKSEKDFIVVLFDELNTKEFISAKGKKAKHFTPLKHNSLDFEKKLLFEKAIKIDKYRIKQNIDRHKLLKENALKWISAYEKIY